MRTHHISGGGGIELHLVEAGNAAGRPLLFIHGFSQCCLCWSRQLDSDLARDYRLIAMDIRGHGLSGKPREAYLDSRLWADDIHAAIQALRLERPVLCGWSYGPLIILDYLRYYGQGAVGALAFVGGVTNLGDQETISLLTGKFLSLFPGFFSQDVEESARSLESLLRLCFARELPQQELYQMLGYSLTVPPHVRRALFSRSLNNDDLLPQIRKPVLIVHGAEDAVVKPEAAARLKHRIPHAQVLMMPQAGHAPFWEQAAAFNRALRDLVNAPER